MPFFKNLKRAFGFSSDDNDTEDNGTPISSVERTPYINPFKNENTAPTQSTAVTSNTPVEDVKIDEVNLSIPDYVLDKVINIINSSLPEIIKNSLNVEEEKKYVFENLNPVFEEYVKNITKTTINQHQSQWNLEREKLNNQVNQMQSTFLEAKNKCEEVKNAQLSFDRQKRALTDKITDLEKSNQKFEADVEQYSLENKSLLNKLKVLQVRYDKGASDDSDYAELKSTIDTLNEKIKTLKTQLEEQKNMPTTPLQNESGVDISSAMIEEMRKRLAEANAEVELKNKEIEILRQKLQLSSEELESVREELNELSGNLEIINEIQEQMASFEEIKKRKDTRIITLTNSLKQRDIEIAELSNTVSALKKTIEDNATKHATAIRELTKDIEQKEIAKRKQLNDSFDMTILDEIVIVADTKSPIYNVKKEISTPAAIKPIGEKQKNEIPAERTIISAIDDSLNNNDWLVPTPPTIEEDIKIEKDIIEGEQPTKTDHKPLDSAQMTLF